MSPSYFYDTTLRQTIRQLEKGFDAIPAERKALIKKLADTMKAAVKEHGKADVIFICTHNSRRSQLADIWFRTVANMYLPPQKIELYNSFSGGTQETAFNYRMVAALERVGFLVEKLDITENAKFKMSPIHLLSSKKWRDRFGQPMFSKRYGYFTNPQSGFIAVMVCSDADESCPVVMGADAQIALTYDDPKVNDGTEEEQGSYDKTIREIGCEMQYLVRLLKK